MLEFYCQTMAPIPDYRSMDPLVLHIAFNVADLAAAMKRLLDAGATVASEAVTTPAGDELAMLRDPWGLAIQLVRRAQPLLA